MIKTQKKIKRLGPIQKIRQDALDAEARKLDEIKKEKSQAVQLLRATQLQYINGVDTLNFERSNGNIDRLLILERGLDLVKDKWHKALQHLREIEADERLQTAQVVAAQINVKSLEKLEDRYVKQLNLEQSKADAKIIDQIALRQFVKN